jgi:hypothetical protein
MGLSLDSGRWDAMTLRPKYFPGVGSPMNLELVKAASTGLNTEAAALQLSGKVGHRVSYDWGLLDGFPILEYCVGGFLLLYVEESGKEGIWESVR